MESITTTSTMPIARVRLASPQAANRSLTLGVRGAFYAPKHTAPAAKDVASLRAWRPPV